MFERPLEPPEPVVVCCCDWCGEEICAGDTAYNIDGSYVCERCIEDCRVVIEEPEPPEEEYE